MKQNAITLNFRFFLHKTTNVIKSSVKCRNSHAKAYVDGYLPFQFAGINSIIFFKGFDFLKKLFS